MDYFVYTHLKQLLNINIGYSFGYDIEIFILIFLSKKAYKYSSTPQEASFPLGSYLREHTSMIN